MTTAPRTLLTVIASAALTFTSYAQWTFEYGYDEVIDPLADSYLFSLTNAEVGLDPFTLQDRYLRPTANFVDALVTYRFDLGAEITAAYLGTRLNTEWSGTSSSQGGIGSIWGSKGRRELVSAFECACSAVLGNGNAGRDFCRESSSLALGWG